MAGMATDLLERDQFLCALDTLLRQAASGQGQLALISGEAGIGKTALIEHFLDHRPADVRTLWGACEALFTPRPLGPLYDIAQQTPTPLRALLEAEVNRATLFAAVLEVVAPEGQTPPTILVIEDLHWADEATLDLVKYLARRIHRTRALLILTYRDDELSKSHPLRLVLGELPARGVTRLRLFPLSEAAVAALAHTTASAAKDLYRATGGNPFYLSEVLANEGPGVPESVVHAVLARVARRSPEVHRLVEVVSIAPGQLEQRIVAAVSAGDDATLDECLAAGILRLDGGALRFRHELARQAVEGALSPARRQALHAAVLRELLTCEAETASLARLVHHAAAAEDAAGVLCFAPAAAQQASSHGAHREAAAYYTTALRYADHLEAEPQAELLDRLAHEHFLNGHMEDAAQSSEAALAIWRALDRPEHVGHSLRVLSHLSWYLVRSADAERHSLAAVALLETLPPGRELAKAYADLATRRMVEGDTDGAVQWGRRATALAEQLGDDETALAALITIGSAELSGGDEGGQVTLERSLQLALEQGYEELVARSYANLTFHLVWRRRFAQATSSLRDGLEYCVEHHLDSWTLYLQGVQARAQLCQGDWSRAEELAATILRVPWTPTSFRVPALLAIGLIRARRGDPGVEALLDEARDLALATGEPQNIVPMAAARAEWRWLQAQPARCREEATVGFQLAVARARPWYLGEVAIWLWRSGSLTETPEQVPSPFGLEIGGDWRAAADVWEQLGCPYEQALALLDGDEAALRVALRLFERLDATTAVELVRRRLRAAGVRGLPRGPRPATRANPHGLTPRQLEILGLLAEGLRNAEIAERLSTTPKTIEHHVSAVLAKLNVRSRAEAVRLAYQLGLVAPPAPTDGHRPARPRGPVTRRSAPHPTRRQVPNPGTPSPI
jgi:DNA-binding CsgD family transcriptional regulator